MLVPKPGSVRTVIGFKIGPFFFTACLQFQGTMTSCVKPKVFSGIYLLFLKDLLKNI